MRSVLLAAGLIILPALTVLGQAAKKDPGIPPPPPQPVTVERIILHPAGAPPRALQYVLASSLVHPLPGDAGPHWKKAFELRQALPHPTEVEWILISRETPLAEITAASLRPVVERYKEVAEAAEAAARYERWEWPTPQPGVGALQDNLEDIQRCREIANVLLFKVRLELVEGKFEQAVRTLRVGFTLGRHLGGGPSFIHSLVGIAISAVIAGQTQDFVSVHGAPNLYWALTALPAPCVDLRRPLAYELNYLTRVVPGLADLEKAALSQKAADAVLEALHHYLRQVAASVDEKLLELPEFLAQLRKEYPTARKTLAAQGFKDELLSRMPESQLLLIVYLQRYNQIRDEFCKWALVPSSEASEGIRRAIGQIPAQKSLVDQLAAWHLPGINKVLSAQVKTDRRIAMLRCVEAIRMHAAAHGRLPAKLSDITEVPVPLNPATGKPFEYHPHASERDIATLYAAPPPGEFAGPHNAQHLEISLYRKP